MARPKWVLQGLGSLLLSICREKPRVCARFNFCHLREEFIISARSRHLRESGEPDFETVDSHFRGNDKKGVGMLFPCPRRARIFEINFSTIENKDTQFDRDYDRLEAFNYLNSFFTGQMLNVCL